MSICPRCAKKNASIELVDGQVLVEKLGGMPDFIGDHRACTVSPVGQSSLEPCWKCPECGYSRTKGVSA